MLRSTHKTEALTDKEIDSPPQPEADNPHYYGPAPANSVGGGWFMRHTLAWLHSSSKIRPDEISRRAYCLSDKLPVSYYSEFPEVMSALQAADLHAQALGELSAGNLGEAVTHFQESIRLGSLWWPKETTSGSDKDRGARIARLGGQAVTWHDFEGVPRYMLSNRQLELTSQVGTKTVPLEEVIGQGALGTVFEPIH